MTCRHIRIATDHRPRKQPVRNGKPPFIHGSEFDSDGEDSMPTPPVDQFKKVPQVGFGMVVLILLSTLGVSL